jgi:LmbE family N-acetylglucosaminyl deacetylase
MASRELTLMAVHAHPDDEATGTGGVLARYSAEGVRTVLVTCTDGRCGDAPGGIKPGEPGHDVDAVVALRRAELEASCAILGLDHLELLGYADSGMDGWPQNDAPGSFWSTPVETAAERLADLIRQYRPDVVVTYDENGFYGHPDHIQAHRITMAAVELTDVPAKVYWTTMPHTTMFKLMALMREQGADLPDDVTGDGTPADGEPQPPFGLPDDEITTWVDTRAFSRTKLDAMAAHSSQSDNVMFLNLGLETFTEYMGVETFSRVKGPTDSARPETDLFAGLRP